MKQPAAGGNLKRPLARHRLDNLMLSNFRPFRLKINGAHERVQRPPDVAFRETIRKWCLSTELADVAYSRITDEREVIARITDSDIREASSIA